MRGLQAGLTAMISCVFAAFLGYFGYSLFHYLKSPELYLVQSAPWYTGVLLYGAVALFIILPCTVLKLILYRKGY